MNRQRFGADSVSECDYCVTTLTRINKIKLSPMQRRLWTRFRWILDVAVLALIGAYVWLNSATREDIQFWDESLYLERGLTLGFSSQPGWEWNPLYSDMYWLLGRSGLEPINAYFAGRFISAMVVVFAVYLSIRLFAGLAIAASGALVMAALPLTYVWPGVANPAGACVVLAIAVAWRWRSFAGWVAASSLLWCAAAMRAEYVWAALTASAVFGLSLIVAVLRRSTPPITAISLGALLMGVPLLLSFGYGSPLELGKRSWEAFSQHYEYRFAVEGDDPWNIAATKVEQDFPEVNSVVGAMTANPSAFAGHIMRNMTWAPITLAGHSAGLGGRTTTENLQGVLVAGAWGISVLVMLIRSRSRILPMFHAIKKQLLTRSNLGSVFVTLLGVGASAISVIVIYPRPHYLVVFAALTVTGSSLLITWLSVRTKLFWAPVIAVLTLSVFWSFAHAYTLATDGYQASNASSLRTIADAGGPPLRLLTPERPIALYARNLTAVEAPQYEADNFADFLTDNRIDVVFDGILFRSAPWSELPGFEQFVQTPETFGFRPIEENSAFLVRDERIK